MWKTHDQTKSHIYVLIPFRLVKKPSQINQQMSSWTHDDNMALATYVEENLNGDPVLVAYCLMYMFKGKFDFKSIYKEVCLWRSVLGATNTGGQASN